MDRINEYLLVSEADDFLFDDLFLRKGLDLLISSQEKEQFELSAKFFTKILSNLNNKLINSEIQRIINVNILKELPKFDSILEKYKLKKVYKTFNKERKVKESKFIFVLLEKCKDPRLLSNSTLILLATLLSNYLTRKYIYVFMKETNYLFFLNQNIQKTENATSNEILESFEDYFYFDNKLDFSQFQLKCFELGFKQLALNTGHTNQSIASYFELLQTLNANELKQLCLEMNLTITNPNNTDLMTFELANCFRNTNLNHPLEGLSDHFLTFEEYKMRLLKVYTKEYSQILSQEFNLLLRYLKPSSDDGYVQMNGWHRNAMQCKSLNVSKVNKKLKRKEIECLIELDFTRISESILNEWIQLRKDQIVYLISFSENSAERFTEGIVKNVDVNHDIVVITVLVFDVDSLDAFNVIYKADNFSSYYQFMQMKDYADINVPEWIVDILLGYKTKLRPLEPQFSLSESSLLTEQQRNALLFATNNLLTVVNGCSGSGKSYLLGKLIDQLLLQNERIVVIVRNRETIQPLFQQISDQTRLLRLGHSESTHIGSVDYWLLLRSQLLSELNESFAGIGVNFQYETIQTALFFYKSLSKEQSAQIDPTLIQQAKRLLPLEIFKKNQERLDYLSMVAASVVCMTSAFAIRDRSKFIKNKISFDTLIIDNAHQLTQVETLLLLSMCQTKRIVFVGDSLQLPPITLPLQQTLFHRLLSITSVCTLDKQGAFVPEIADLFRHSYPTVIQDLPHVNNLRLNVPFPHLQFIHIPSTVSTPRPHYHQNLIHAEYAVQLFMYLKLSLPSYSTIALLSLYQGQVDLILDIIQTRRVAELVGLPDAVNTVDAYSGRRADWSVVSMVRGGQFLSKRRWRAMCSSGSSGMWVVGDKEWAENVEWRDGVNVEGADCVELEELGERVWSMLKEREIV